MSIPEFKRCCFCIPLRYGLLMWGYIKLIMLFVTLLFYLFILYEFIRVFLAFYVFYGMPLIVFAPHIALAVGIMLVLATDICLTIVFVVGSHRKSVKLLNVFYVYSIVMLCIFTLFHTALLSYILYCYGHLFRTSTPTSSPVSTPISTASLTPTLVQEKSPYDLKNIVYTIIFNVIIGLGNIGTQSYMIIMIRSEIIKLRNTSNSKFTFTNIANEAKCTMENGTGNTTDDFRSGIYDYENGSNGYNNGTGGHESETSVHNITDVEFGETIVKKESFDYRKLY